MSHFDSIKIQDVPGGIKVTGYRKSRKGRKSIAKTVTKTGTNRVATMIEAMTELLTEAPSP